VLPPPSLSQTVTRRSIGRMPDGLEIAEFTLDAGAGVTLSALNLGGVVTALRCPDRAGRQANVVLALASLRDHLERDGNFGGLVGRYANRIAGGRFELGGRVVELPRNQGRHTLHGGPDPFGARWWSITPLPAGSDGSAAIELRLASDDGDQGFPGRLDITVRYTLTRAAEWRIDYRATTDRTTVLNLTHHAYWNLAGGGDARGHHLTLAGSRYMTIDEALIPETLAPVDATPFDFRAGAVVATRLRERHAQLRHGRGFDHFFEIDRSAPGLAFAARVEDPASGRVLEIETTEPGLQFYSGNCLDGSLQGADGAMLRQGDGLCLETQHAADSPNRPEWPSTVLEPGQVFTSTTVHRLRVAR
jgi:aldose 1-epimerase